MGQFGKDIASSVSHHAVHLWIAALESNISALLLPCCFSADGVESVGLEDPAAFLDDVEAVGVEVFEGVALAGGPADFYVDGFSLVEAEVEAEVVL